MAKCARYCVFTGLACLSPSFTIRVASMATLRPFLITFTLKLMIFGSNRVMQTASQTSSTSASASSHMRARVLSSLWHFAKSRCTSRYFSRRCASRSVFTASRQESWKSFSCWRSCSLSSSRCVCSAAWRSLSSCSKRRLASRTIRSTSSSASRSSSSFSSSSFSSTYSSSTSHDFEADFASSCNPTVDSALSSAAGAAPLLSVL
mmetsp:Transcript_6945/g.11593  ORF Transcript_6945/g.11593 Transcript_6945/m.11593 type:complete len:205 (+) Transcript_6945:455-1069(+)